MILLIDGQTFDTSAMRRYSGEREYPCFYVSADNKTVIVVKFHRHGVGITASRAQPWEIAQAAREKGLGELLEVLPEPFKPRGDEGQGVIALGVISKEPFVTDVNKVSGGDK